MNNWLDKYEDGGYLGTTNVGRNYSPAWGGQFDMGGDIPGSVGFTYARTGDIPDNGKYAKKTLPSAQNGKEMKYYQEGLDFQPKTISQKGSRIPPDNRARGDMQSSYPQIARMYDGPQRKALAEAIAKREDEQRARRIIESQPSVSQYTPNKELEAANRYKFAKQYAATHGGYADDEGNIEETFVDRAMDSKIAAKAWDNIVVPGFEAEMLVSGAGLVGQGLKAAGKYAVENTALKNAYKLNPLAEKLINANKSYRVTGLDAFEDFKNTGVLRSAQQGVPEGASLTEKAMSRPTGFPSFQKGYADMRYLPEEGGVVFETGLPTYKRGEINPVTGNKIKGRHYAHRAIDPTTGATLAEIPASDIRVFGGKPNWLKGYKELPKPTSSFKSDINWGAWNKEIPSNKALMQEYNAIEQTSKANGSWMKNPDGSAFQGTPEQFVQQNSENFKKAFPEGSENVFRGTGENIAELRPNRSTFTANQELASGYAPFNKKLNFLNSESVEGGVHSFYRKNSKNSIELDANNTSWTSVDLSNKRLTKDYFERNIKSQEDQIIKQKEYLSKMKQKPDGSWEAPDGTLYSNHLYKNTVKERELHLKDLKERYKNIDNLISNPKELEEMRKVLGNTTTTDNIAAYVEKRNLDYVKLKNIEDSGVGDVTIVNHKPGNYLKSAIGNSGMFDMNNPNIYKALVPAVAGGASAFGMAPLEQKKQGGVIKDNRGQWAKNKKNLLSLQSNWLSKFE